MLIARSTQLAVTQRTVKFRAFLASSIAVSPKWSPNEEELRIKARLLRLMHRRLPKVVAWAKRRYHARLAVAPNHRLPRRPPVHRHEV